MFCCSVGEPTYCGGQEIQTDQQRAFIRSCGSPLGNIGAGDFALTAGRRHDARAPPGCLAWRCAAAEPVQPCGPGRRRLIGSGLLRDAGRRPNCGDQSRNCAPGRSGTWIEQVLVLRTMH
jgi:hypothetical protein